MTFQHDNLRVLMAYTSQTPQEVAAALGVNTISVYNWQAGKNQPRTKHLAGLSEILGVPVNYFFSKLVISTI
jgi:transcriptional regulator with XRE-family HTH domain